MPAHYALAMLARPSHSQAGFLVAEIMVESPLSISGMELDLSR
jgi:hypothetical protein